MPAKESVMLETTATVRIKIIDSEVNKSKRTKMGINNSKPNMAAFCSCWRQLNMTFILNAYYSQAVFQ